MATLDDKAKAASIIGVAVGIVVACFGIGFPLWDHLHPTKPVVLTNPVPATPTPRRSVSSKSVSTGPVIGNGNAVGSGNTVYNGPVNAAPVIAADQEQLLDDAFDMMKRLHVLQADWADAQLKVRIAGANGAFPIEQMDSKQATVDAEFDARYGSDIAPVLIVLKSRLLTANPSAHSYRDYEQISSFDSLLDVEQDFATLRSEYKRKVSTSVNTPNVGLAQP